MECWPHLHTVVFAPRQSHEHVFNETLPLLLHLPFLRHLTINSAGGLESHVPILAQLRHLETLTIHSPSRAVLHILPELLGHLMPGLKALHLMVCIRLCYLMIYCD